MRGTFKPRMDILPPAQQRLWPALRPAAAMGFALYGGTAIALRLGHRQSVDFDFFSHKPLDRNGIYTTFPFIAKSTVLQDEQNTLTVQIPCGDSEQEYVKVSFFGDINIGRVGEPDITDDGVLHVASLDDLMATKVKIILQRAEAKDYRDIGALLNAGVNLSKGLAAARELYGLSFQPSESLKAMVYFEDGDLRTLTKDEKTCLVKAVSAVRDLPLAAIADRQLTVPVSTDHESA
jgi:Nucleotidyl transferase AbiEii toxin, Type IV TA system